MSTTSYATPEATVGKTRTYSRFTLILAIGMAALLLAAGHARAAFGPLGADFRISNTGTDGDANRRANAAAVAYNPTANEYLVTWQSDGLATDNETEIFGQRVAADGTELGSDFRISNTGTDGDANRDAFQAAVAYNPNANEYLVTWHGDGLATDEESEIFGQRVSAAGAELGTDFRISNTGTDGDANRDAFVPAVAFNPTANEYLVTWQGDGLATDNENEIFGQRVSAAGAELGTDFRISNAGTDADATRDAQDPAVAYNPGANEYLVTWDADGLATDDESEVFGQRLSGAGAEVGADFRVSNTGTDGDAARDATTPALAYNSAANEYLVTWEGDGLALDEEYEVFGQRVSAAGAEVGSDFPLSNTGTDGDAARDAFAPAVAYSPVANEYLVSFEADALVTDDETEIFGQRVSPAGAEVGGDVRISNTGTDGDAARDANTADVAFNPTANEYLAVWHGDGLAADNDIEVFGRRIEGEPPPPPPPPPDNTFTIGKLKHTKLSVTVPGPGVIDVDDAAAAKQKPLLKHSSATASDAGTVQVTLKLTKTAKKTLKKRGKVKVKAAITFTPTGGTANSQSKGLKIKD